MTVTFTVDTGANPTPFPHYWELCVGSCHAVMGLRQDWREQLEKAHKELGFRYVRFHGLLNDEMSVCLRNQDGSLRYSFYTIDNIFDFLLSIGMKPFIELGFMPEALASGKTTCFHYRGNITPPADYEQWAMLIEQLTCHLVDRYGLDEVRTWFFEVWNEPNLKFFFDGTQQDYFRLYETSARTIKKVDSRLRVGGPATSVNAWIPEMLDYCRNTNTPIDFVSTHHYPTDDPLWKNNGISLEEFFAKFGSEFGKYERGILKKMTIRALEEAGDIPLYYTEWNTSAVLPDTCHDEPYSAALVAKTIADNEGLVDSYSFWTFSDLFEENGQYAAPFHGGFGLQTIHGIPKPTYHVFEMLHQLGSERLTVSGGENSTVEVLAVKEKDHRIDLLVFNHNIPEDLIKAEDIEIQISGLKSVRPVRVLRVDDYHGNPKHKWVELGSPEYPSHSQIAKIRKASLLTNEPLCYDEKEGEFLLRLEIPPHGVALIQLIHDGLFQSLTS